tara:strand:- start:17282 stop:17800 length:519 start_codon:yes stop_codon:yes gene_type:complete
MRKKRKKLGQYIDGNHEYEFSEEDFLANYASLIGLIVLKFNSLESELNSNICTIINGRSDIVGVAIIHKMNFSSKVDLFKRLIMIMDLSNEMSVDIDKFLNQLRECAILRNAVVHSEWENISSDKYVYSTIKFSKDSIDQEYTQFTLESLEKIKNLINQTYLEFGLIEGILN